MRDFTAAELARMEDTQESAMQDSCQVGVRTSTQDSYGQAVPTFTYGTAIACGFDPTGGRKNYRPDMTPLHIEATVRLPMGTAVSSKDRIKITHRFGTALSTALVFEVMGNPQQGPSGLVLELAAVTP